MSSLRIAGFALVFLWFMLGGIAHFVALDAFTTVVPPYVPYPREVTLFTGLCDIAGALGILWPRTRRIAGYALMVYCVCVTPVHIDMLQHADRYPIGPGVLWARLLFQPVLIWIIWLITRPEQPRALPGAPAPT